MNYFPKEFNRANLGGRFSPHIVFQTPFARRYCYKLGSPNGEFSILRTRPIDLIRPSYPMNRQNFRHHRRRLPPFHLILINQIPLLKMIDTHRTTHSIYWRDYQSQESLWCPHVVIASLLVSWAAKQASAATNSSPARVILPPTPRTNRHRFTL